MNLTIERVYPKAREWTGQYGPSAAVKVLFSDGSEGDCVTKPEKVEELKATFEGLVGKPSEFEVVEKPEYNGVAQRQIKTYPGKPQGGNFGGGGGMRTFTPTFSQTKEGAILDETMTNARTALMQAVTLAQQDHEAPLTAQAVTTIADEMFRWLQSKMESAVRAIAAIPAPAAVQPAPQPSASGPTGAGSNGNGHTQPAVAAPPTNGAAKLPRGTVNETGAPCPTCHAPTGRPHLGPCV